MEPADVDMTVVGVGLSARVAPGVLLPHVPDGEVVAQQVADGDSAHREPVAAERRRYRDVVVQPVDRAAEWRRADDDELTAFVHRPHLVHRLRYRHLTFHYRTHTRKLFVSNGCGPLLHMSNIPWPMRSSICMFRRPVDCAKTGKPNASPFVSRI